MIVVSIIGILAAIAIPKFADLVRKSREGATKGNLGSIRGALSIYYSDMEGLFPKDHCVMGCLPLGAGLLNLTVNGKFLATIPKAYPADYHAPLATLFDTSDSGMIQWDTTAWAYDDMGFAPLRLGQVVVNCTHTDSHGSLWTTY